MKKHVAVLALVILNVLGTGKVWGMLVPASEVPGSCTWILDARCTHSTYYDRVDGAGIVESAGTPDTTEGTASGGELDCNNCADSKNSMNCMATLSVSFTATIQTSIDSSIGVKAGIEASLKSAMGASGGETKTFTTTCGSSAIAPCSHTKYKIYQNVTRGKSVTVTSTYTCYCEITGGPNPPCVLGTNSQSGGTRVSRASGDIPLMTGGCRSQGIACP